jgi:hypothetical protein
MDNSGPLVPFGIAIIVISALLIVVPYLRRRADALTAWNLFLLGGAIFMGMGCLEVAYGIWHWPELQWFQPTRQEVQTYMLGVCAFYATLLVSYYLLRLPRKISAAFLNSWPPMTTGLLIFILSVNGLLSVASLFSRGVFFVGPLLFNISHKAVLFATVFSFCHWYRNKLQLPLLALFLGILGYAALYSIVAFAGRRLVLSVLVAPLICMYWLNWRYASPKKSLLRLGMVALIAVAVTAFYSSFRHFDVSKDSESGERSFASAIAALKTTSASAAMAQVRGDFLHYFAQYCGHFSLLTIHMVQTGEIPVEPVNSLIYLAGYPVPRVIWPGKPEPLGIRIVYEFLHLPYHTNWGLGIVANGYQEGGFVVIMLYAFLVVVLIRLVDDSLARQPENRFLLAMFCASAPHFVTMIRGEPCVMVSEIGEAIAYAWILGLVGRFMFGTAPTIADLSRRLRGYSPRTGQLGQARN